MFDWANYMKITGEITMIMDNEDFHHLLIESNLPDLEIALCNFRIMRV